MIKALIKLLVVGSGCSTIAVMSTSYASIDADHGKLSKSSEPKRIKIDRIQTYGDIEAFGKQKGCAFRIIDNTNKNKPEEYPIAEFLANRKSNELSDFEKTVVKVANDAGKYCGTNFPVMAIFYNSDEKIEISKRFTLNRIPLINGKLQTSEKAF